MCRPKSSSDTVVVHVILKLSLKTKTIYFRKSAFYKINKPVSLIGRNIKKSDYNSPEKDFKGENNSCHPITVEWSWTQILAIF